MVPLVYTAQVEYSLCKGCKERSERGACAEAPQQKVVQRQAPQQQVVQRRKEDQGELIGDIFMEIAACVLIGLFVWAIIAMCTRTRHIYIADD